LDRKGLICFNVKSIELVKGSLYLACDDCSIPNLVKLQKKYNSDLLGKSSKNIKPKDKFVLFHGRNTCRCSSVVEIFIKIGLIKDFCTNFFFYFKKLHRISLINIKKRKIKCILLRSLLVIHSFQRS
jgi:hypothetical protein